MTQHDDQLYVWHMLESAEKARHFAYGKTRADFESDEVLRLALIHLVQIIGEAARSVSPAMMEAHPEIPWKTITGMRHRLVHGYADVDEEVVWKTLIEDLPPLIESLREALGLA